jgi:hypothetical protein
VVIKVLYYVNKIKENEGEREKHVTIMTEKGVCRRNWRKETLWKT